MPPSCERAVALPGRARAVYGRSPVEARRPLPDVCREVEDEGLVLRLVHRGLVLFIASVILAEKPKGYQRGDVVLEGVDEV